MNNQRSRVPDKVEKPNGDRYLSSDEYMIESLIMKGYQFLEVKRNEKDQQLVYSFCLEEVWWLVEKILTNDVSDITFTLTEFFHARGIWQMNLKHWSRVRSTRV